MKRTVWANARLGTAIGVMAALVAGPVFAGNTVPNSDKVDGFHAVGSGTKIGKRGGKLVATNSQGRLPNNIISKAPDAERLDGLDSNAFVRTADAQNFASTSDLAAKQDDRRHVKIVDIATDGSGDPLTTQSGTDLLSALDGIGHASASDPWVVLLAPGVYDLGNASLTVGDHVTLIGAGRDRTTVKASGSGATVFTANGSTLQDLRIEHTGGTQFATGVLHYNGADARMTRVDVVAEDGTGRTEAVAVDYGKMILKDVDLAAYTASGTGNGITLGGGADVDVYDSEVLGRFGTYANGIYAGPDSYVRVYRSDVEGRSAPSSWGIYAEQSSGEVLDSVIRSNAASSNAVALEVTQPASGTRRYEVRNSTLEAWRNIDDATNSWTVVGRASTTINVAGTQLDGGNPFSAGTLKCAGVYDENFNFSAATCFP